MLQVLLRKCYGLKVLPKHILLMPPRDVGVASRDVWSCVFCPHEQVESASFLKISSWPPLSLLSCDASGGLCRRQCAGFNFPSSRTLRDDFFVVAVALYKLPSMWYFVPISQEGPRWKVTILNTVGRGDSAEIMTFGNRMRGNEARQVGN